MRLTTFDGVLILGLLLVFTGLAFAEEEPPFVKVLSTSSNSTNGIHVTNVALKRLMVVCNKKHKIAMSHAWLHKRSQIIISKRLDIQSCSIQHFSKTNLRWYYSIVPFIVFQFFSKFSPHLWWIYNNNK